MSPKKNTTFSDEELAAMKEYAKEKKAQERLASSANKAAEEEAAVVEKIAEMDGSDRTMAERIHAMIKANAPVLAPRLWYGMPAYSMDGKVVCFFQPAQKFKTRYATFGFNDSARLDDGNLWPVAYALTSLTDADEARLAELVKKAVR